MPARWPPMVPGLMVVALASRAGLAFAGGGASTDAYEGIDGARPLDLHGLADIYAQTNLAAPSTSPTLWRAFDGPANPPSLGALSITLAHAPRLVGFRVDVVAGNVADAYFAYDPARTSHPALSRDLSYVGQAFVTLMAPLARPVEIDIGKFSTPVGLEDNVSLANWNYTRGLLFTLAEPTYHTGARVTTQLVKQVALTAFWLNGWNTNVVAGDGMRSFGVAVSAHPTMGLEVSAAYVGGLERAPTRLADLALSFRDELATYATYRLTDRIGLAVTVDYGRDAARTGASWGGVGGYARAQLLSWLAVVARGEQFADPDGFMTARRESIVEGTGTLEARFTVRSIGLVERVEYRRDQSAARPFEGLTHDDTLAVGVVAAF